MKLFLVFAGMFLCLQLVAQKQNDKDSAAYYYSKGQYARALPFAKKSFDNVKHSTTTILYISLLHTHWLMYTTDWQ